MKQESNIFFKPLSELKEKYTAISQANKIDILTQKIERLESLLIGFMSKFDEKFNLFQKSPTNESNQSTRQQKQPTQLEPRFTQLKFPIQKTIDMQQSRRMLHLKEFSAGLASKVVSKGFVWFEEGKFTDQKFRHFFCNNFLSNILRYAITNKLGQKQLQSLNQHLKSKVLGFLKQKYPQNQYNSSNQKFSSIIMSVDNFQANSNDLVHKSGIKFIYKKNGDYCKEIMQFINYIIGLIRQQRQDGKNLFQHFMDDMENIFKKVQSQQWMIRAQQDLFQLQKSDLKAQHKQNNNYHIHGQSQKKQKISQDQSKKQQYRKQVKQYTKYLIGKKISDNVSSFSNKQIQQQNLTVKSTQVMRIMTKWCQQLQKCFSEVNIYSRDQRFMMEDGTQRYLNKKTRLELFNQIQEQQVELQKFVQQVKNNIYENQYQLFKDSKRMDDFTDFASSDEEITGYFATVMRKSYQNYLISYLNELIHRILTAKQKLKYKYDKKDYYKIATSLISFKIADLLRCKCSSKQTQIIALYKYLKKYSEKFPSILELVRVKNRLNEGTKDILFNFMYRKKLLVQVQLTINQDTSNFIKCSDKANHFLYEIQRATFGPISEICNVYCSVDPRADYFTKLFQTYNKKTIQKGKVQTCEHKLKQFSLPLWCSQCNKFISRSNLIAKHIKCQKCNYSKCSFCLIRDGQVQKFKVSKKKLNFQNLIKPSSSIIRKKIQILDLDKKNAYKYNIYIIYFNFKLIFFQALQPNQGYILLGQAKNQKEFNDFFSQKQIIQQQIITKAQQSLLMSIHHEIVKLMIKNVNKKQRKYFVIQSLKIEQTVPFNEKMPTVQMINMNNIHIQSISPVVQAFPNAKNALLVKNKITDLKNIQNWKNIEQLNLQGNCLKQLPAQIKQLKNLKFLILTKNKFQQVPDQLCQILCLQTLNFKQNQIQKISTNIGRLKYLKILRLNQNIIKVIPPQIIQLKELIEIDFSKNNIQKIPEQLKKLTKLQIIAFSTNKLTSIDDNTFQQMNQIQKVDFSNNKLQKIPDSLKDKQKLLLIDFDNNKLTKIPEFIFKLPKLEELQLNINQISQIQIPKTISSKLKILQLVKNKLQTIPKQIFQIKTIQTFNLGKNLLKQIPLQILDLKQLKQVNFENFNLKQFPSIIFKMNNLQKIDLNHNQISSISSQIQKFATSLRQLQLNYNKFTQFPKYVLCLTNLESLGLNGNFISQFPVEISKLQNLEKLKLEQMDIKTLPIEYGKNNRLRQLFVTEDRLSDKQSFKKILQTNEKIRKQWKKRQQNN